ncbi:uncharacterized protein KQ657_001785 [Scheffersomyces spartinae]|uniref:Importin N-terminal domain-containing protein n=1 Tax=Scheffersomyces spartinae TaxID=45513 RepID=A0A9P8AH27_9ASCO|nr:uncharacterized protein KQ657_001785 [Scheffersomyces spartinae]KAG7192386.1 hypothetical protein KQ657_001785 [Scheffersomyces spartinae]
MELLYPNLLTVLSLANGERNQQQQQAEAQLKIWEVQQGYHYLLQEVYLKTEVPLQERWLAILCFKNGIDKYWRSSKQNAISKEEKQQIRSRVFMLLSEKNNQLTIQNAHLIGRIVRFDFPNEWPTLFDDIVQYLEDLVFSKNDLVSTNNLLIILNQIIKTVSQVRIGRARHAMQSKAPLVVPILVRLYIKFFQEWTQTIDLSLMEVCYLCLKNLRRLIPEGFEQPHKNVDIVEFLKVSIAHLQLLVVEHEKYSSDLLERYVKCYSKVYYNLISVNPTSFVLLPCSQDILTTFLSLLELKAEVIYNSNEEENDFWETLALKGFMILKKIIAYIYKKGAVVLKQRNEKEEVNMAIKKLSTEFFTPQVVQHLCDLIINWYLKLKPCDLESWQLEPEEWCNEELSKSWEYQIRPCAENFFQDLISFFKDILTDFVLNKISNGLVKNNNVEDILVKDSIFSTFQLSSTSIANNVNFDELLTQIFIPQGLNNDMVENKIIKRRVCLIISEWVSVDCSRQSRLSIYKFLVTLMDPQNKLLNDKVVKLTAIQTLKSVIDDWDFQKVDIQPYINDFIQLSLIMLDEMDFTESKLFILNTLAMVLERCNPLVPIDTLMQVLAIVPGFWQMSTDTNEMILKTALLRVLKSLVVTLNEKSPAAYSICLPLIKASCASGNSENYSLLGEDGYELWLSVLQYCPQSEINNQIILNLFELIRMGLLEGTESLPIVMSIIRSYSLISPQLFQSEEALELFRILSGYLSNMRDDSLAIFIALMDILMLECGDNQLFLNNLISSGLFSALVHYAIDEKQAVVSANKAFLVLSRLAQKSPETFFNILNHLSIDKEPFLTKWVDYYKSNGNPRNKKSNLVGLISLTLFGLKQGSSIVIQLWPTVIKYAFLFMEELNEDGESAVNLYDHDFVYEDINDYNYLDPTIAPHGENIRYKSLLERSDLVYTVKVSRLIHDTLTSLKQTLSSELFQTAISSTDAYTMEKLHAYRT